MTLGDLNQHLALVNELIKAEDMLQSLWNAACPGGQILTGMPHASGVKDKIGDLATDIADLETEIELMQKQVDKSAQNVTNFISTIPDVQTRMIFRIRFCRGYEWKQVARVLGGGNSEASVKAVAYRYLESCNVE